MKFFITYVLVLFTIVLNAADFAKAAEITHPFPKVEPIKLWWSNNGADNYTGVREPHYVVPA